MRKFITLALVATLMALATLTGCTGSKTKTVQSFVEEAQKSGQLDALTQMGGDLMTMEIEGTEDTLIIKATFKEEIPGDIAELKATFETALDQQASVFTTQAQEIAKATGRDAITVRVVYYTSAGEEIISKDFSNK